MHTRRTLYLDPVTWDIALTASGHIAAVQGEFATAQNVANECRLFVDDAYFAQDQGIPHFAMELGQKLSPSVLRGYLHSAAMLVDDVAEIQNTSITSFNAEHRILSGEIFFTTGEGEHVSVAI